MKKIIITCVAFLLTGVICIGYATNVKACADYNYRLYLYDGMTGTVDGAAKKVNYKLQSGIDKITFQMNDFLARREA